MNLLNENGMGARLKKLYRGLDTLVIKTLSASGVDLSGGERQKIAVVRALYKDASILVLDEPMEKRQFLFRIGYTALGFVIK